MSTCIYYIIYIYSTRYFTINLTLFYSQENLILFFDIEYGRKRVGSRLALALLLGKLKPS